MSQNMDEDTMTLDEGTVPDFFGAAMTFSSTSPPLSSHSHTARPSSPPTPTTPGSLKKNRATFPKARIKKIMQMDEDVGKIAGSVPVLVSRCLELFIHDLVKQSAGVTRSKNGRTITMSHLKECIESNDKFDFLRDKVQNLQISENAAALSDDEEMMMTTEVPSSARRKRKSIDVSFSTPTKRAKRKKEDSPSPVMPSPQQRLRQLPQTSPKEYTHQRNMPPPLTLSPTTLENTPPKRTPHVHVPTPLPSMHSGTTYFDNAGGGQQQLPSLHQLLNSIPPPPSNGMQNNSSDKQ